MSAWTLVVNFLVKTLWPWFLKFAWPLIKDHFIGLITFIIGKITEMAKSMFADKASDREREAQQNFEEAKSKASSATNDTEAEKYHAIAEVWREVAEQYRRDNEELKIRLGELEREVQKFSMESVDRMELDVDFGKDKPIMSLNGKRTELPALPQ